MLTIKTSKAVDILDHYLNDVDVEDGVLTTPKYLRGDDPNIDSYAVDLPDVGISGDGSSWANRYVFLESLNPFMHFSESVRGEGVPAIVRDVTKIDKQLIPIFAKRCLNIAYTEGYNAEREGHNGEGFSYVSTGAGFAAQKFKGQPIQVWCDWYTGKGTLDTMTATDQCSFPLIQDIEGSEMGECSTDDYNTALGGYAGLPRRGFRPRNPSNFPKLGTSQMARSSDKRATESIGEIRLSDKYDSSACEWNGDGGKNYGFTRAKDASRITDYPVVGPCIAIPNLGHYLSEANTKAIANSSAFIHAYALANNIFAYLALYSWGCLFDDMIWGGKDDLGKFMYHAFGQNSDRGYNPVYDFSKVVVTEKNKDSDIHTMGVRFEQQIEMDLPNVLYDPYHVGATRWSANTVGTIANVHGCAVMHGTDTSFDTLKSNTRLYLGPTYIADLLGTAGENRSIVFNENGAAVYGVQALDKLDSGVEGAKLRAPGAIGHVIGTGHQGNCWPIIMNYERNFYDWFDHGPIDSNLAGVILFAPRSF